MDTDLIFVVGVVISIIAIPAIMSAVLDGRAPRAAALVILIGAFLIGYAVKEMPNSYSLATVPDVFLRVVADMAR